MIYLGAPALEQIDHIMLVILATHPVPYQVHIWKALASDGRVPFEVWYLTHHGVKPSFDRGFGKTFEWDINLLAGYDSMLMPNGPDVLPDGFMGLRLHKSFGELLKKKRVTAIWVQGWQVMAFWEAAWKAHAAGIPVWLRGESNDLAPVPYWKRPIKKLLLGQFFKLVENFTYIGKANKRLYENYNVPPEKLYPAPYCADNSRFAEQSEMYLPKRYAIRKAWNIPEKAFCILFVGKFIHKKRPFDLILAARSQRLKELQVPLHLIFVGAGELQNQLREGCNVVFDAEKSMPLKNNLNHTNSPSASFVGFLNQTKISRAHVVADCMVLPSDHGETWGLVVNEALASGLPCAVSKLVGCGEDIIEPMNPLLRFDMGDIDGIANALIEIYQRNYTRAEAQAQVHGYDVTDNVNTAAALYYNE